MVKHMVLWKLNNEAKLQGVNSITEMLQEKFSCLIGLVSGLTHIEVGQNYNGGEYDIVLYCEFIDRLSQDKYQIHPEHLKIKEIVHGLVCDRTCVDYEV